MNNESFWNSFLENINSKLTSLSFDTWFAGVKLKKMDASSITIELSNIFTKQFVVDHYDEMIDDAIRDITGKHYNISYTCPEEDIKLEPIKETVNQLIDTEYKEINSGLNKNMTFDNFMVGDSNRFAQTTALAVAEEPGKLYNPYFIYGNSGLGKTHLMHAIGNYIVENSNKTVLYVTAEQFLDDFMQITNKNNTNNFELVDHFKDKYRNIDVLIIDDIQMMGDAPVTQAEFFNTFESLHSANKQIILSSDKSPDGLKKFEDRLKTRFHWGLTVTIHPTDYDLKIKILKSKLSEYEFSKQIKPEVLDYIANNFQSDVRHLEGAVNRLFACVSMFTPKEVDLEFARTNLGDMASSTTYLTNNIARIQKEVAEYFDLTVDTLKSKRRNAEIKNARQLAVYLCKMNTDESLQRIGLEFNLNHSTVIHSCTVIEDRLKKDEELQRQIKEIKDRLGS